MDKNLFLKNMEEMIQIAKTNGNQIDHKELLDYFSDYELNEEAKKLLIASFVEAGIRVLGVDEAQIVAEEEAKEKADISEEEQGAIRFYKEELEQEILKLEQEYPGSVSLSSGACLHCKNAECTRLSGKPCRFQDKMRYSIESLGGNVGKTVTKYLKQELQWVEEGKLPEYFMLIYGLLIP